MTAADVRLASAQEVTVGDPQVEKIERDRDRDHRRRHDRPDHRRRRDRPVIRVDPRRIGAIGRSGPSVATDRSDSRRAPIVRCGARDEGTMSKTPRALLWVTLLLFPLNAYAQGEQWQVGTAPSFSSGRYGTDTRTDVFYTPITARRLFDDGDLTFVIPMTCIRGNGGVIVVNGMPVRQERLDAAARDGNEDRNN